LPWGKWGAEGGAGRRLAVYVLLKPSPPPQFHVTVWNNNKVYLKTFKMEMCRTLGAQVSMARKNYTESFPCREEKGCNLITVV
jgi:hypothetical protein